MYEICFNAGWRRAPPMLALLALIALASVSRVKAACPGTASSIRLMNYNVALIFGPSNNVAELGMEDTDRIDAIADRILNGGGDPDVIALEEVWHVDFQNQFILKLQGKYPHYVKNALGGQWWTPLYTLERQAGLMLFSKYPFARFSVTVDTPRYRVNGRTAGSNFSVAGPNALVAARMYKTCSGSDCLQDKGVLMVRIRNECTKDTFNVVWTHMQSSYDDADESENDGYVEDRSVQFTAIKELILTSLTLKQLKEEAIYLLGDLNVDGNLNKTPATEWNYHFNTNAADDGFFACNTPVCTFDPPSKTTGTLLKDSWAFETSPMDFGPTAARSDIGADNYDLEAEFPSFFEAGKRYDYILHSVPSRRDVCMQHIVIAHDMKGAVNDEKGNAKGKHYSDHLPIRGDFNKSFARCTPRKKDALNLFGAELVDVTSVQTYKFPHPGDSNTKIANPGNVQWYIIEKPGTYGIQISPGFKRVIYQADDLSTPMSLYGAEKSERFGFKYSLKKPPYLVKAFGNTRTTVGKYEIRFHKFECSNAGDDACLLEPAEKELQEWPNVIVNQEDTKYWAFYTDTARPSNAAPVVTFTLESNQAGNDHNIASVKLLEGDGTTAVSGVIESPWTLNSDGVTYSKILTAPPLPGDSGNKPKRYLIAVTRKAVNANTTTSLMFGTTLTYVTPTSLKCVLEQTDGPDLDDTWGKFYYDGVSATAEHVFIHRFDREQSNPVPASLRGSFVSEFVPKLWEDSDLDVSSLVPGETFEGPFVDYLEHKTLPLSVAPLPPETAMMETSFSFTDEPFNEAERDFFYTLYFRLSHKQLCSTASQCGDPAEVQCGPKGLCQEKN
jgi:endonuclease/exonuclease/phosphatase family metal-dependent hydrolase